MIEVIKAWWRRRQHEQLLRRRFREFESDPAARTRSASTRALIASPIWNEKVRAPGTARIISISEPRKAQGRDYVLDLLRLERAIRFGSWPWAWRGVQEALRDDLLKAVYAEEYLRLAEELLESCDDEIIYVTARPTREHVQGQAHALISDGLKTLKGKAARPGGAA